MFRLLRGHCTIYTVIYTYIHYTYYILDIYINMYICIHIYIYIYICIMYIYIYMCIYLCILQPCILPCIYVHTVIYTAGVQHHVIASCIRGIIGQGYPDELQHLKQGAVEEAGQFKTAQLSGNAASNAR